jgi:hypothetical protein
MKILGLDLSTHLGYAVNSDGSLGEYEVKHLNAESSNYQGNGTVDDYRFIFLAENAAEFVKALLAVHRPDLILIEQTNLGKSRTDQKLLEFIHFAVLKAIEESGAAAMVNYVDSSAWRSGLQIKLSKDQRAHNKAVKAKTVRGKITPKHLSVDWVNKKYGLSLLLKDNDKADAICIAAFGQKLMNAPKPVPVDVAALFKKS